MAQYVGKEFRRRCIIDYDPQQLPKAVVDRCLSSFRARFWAASSLDAIELVYYVKRLPEGWDNLRMNIEYCPGASVDEREVWGGYVQRDGETLMTMCGTLSYGSKREFDVEVAPHIL